MVLAIWVGATVEHVPFNLWLLGGLGAAALLANVVNLIRRGNIVDLRGSSIFALWVTTRFVLTPALFLLGLAWLICAMFKLAAAAVLLKALAFVAVHGLAAIFLTSTLMEVAAAIKGSGRDPPSES